MEVGQGPNWGCSAKGKKSLYMTMKLEDFNVAILRASTLAHEYVKLL
jgi:hypothetical protein